MNWSQISSPRKPRRYKTRAPLSFRDGFCSIFNSRVATSAPHRNLFSLVKSPAYLWGCDEIWWKLAVVSVLKVFFSVKSKNWTTNSGTRIILEDEIGGEDDGSSYKCCRGDVHVKVTTSLVYLPTSFLPARLLLRVDFRVGSMPFLNNMHVFWCLHCQSMARCFSNYCKYGIPECKLKNSSLPGCGHHYDVWLILWQGCTIITFYCFRGQL